MARDLIDMLYSYVSTFMVNKVDQNKITIKTNNYKSSQNLLCFFNSY